MCHIFNNFYWNEILKSRNATLSNCPESTLISVLLHTTDTFQHDDSLLSNQTKESLCFFSCRGIIENLDMGIFIFLSDTYKIPLKKSLDRTHTKEYTRQNT